MEKEERRVLGELINYYEENLERYAKLDHECVFIEVFDGEIKEIFFDNENYLKKVLKELDEFVYFAARINKDVEKEKHTVMTVKSQFKYLNANIEDDKFSKFIHDDAKRNMKGVRYTLLDSF